MDLTMETITKVIHVCETYAAIKQGHENKISLEQKAVAGFPICSSWKVEKDNYVTYMKQLGLMNHLVFDNYCVNVV
ncbi:hypothetical protein WISP_122340 [Willisornis vidua]|uniref:Uncharacterized protein n=1 Tax=Willisornis vidua TaxID=1566151 RepID=A0ABQ9CS76_9PASS|nr:hypothetical protein WISP_122340 [Willisornis vidua]